MAVRAMSLVVALLAVVLVAACGDTRSPARRAMETKFEKIDFEMGNMETLSVAYNHARLEDATQRYIALVRHYANQLGPREARRRLKDKGDEVAPYCLPCTAMLESEATRY
jgi:hypothetical protein